MQSLPHSLSIASWEGVCKEYFKKQTTKSPISFEMSPQNCPNHLNFHLFSSMTNNLAVQTKSKQISNKKYSKKILTKINITSKIINPKTIQNRKSKQSYIQSKKFKTKFITKQIPSTQIIRTLPHSKKSPNGHSKNQSKNQNQIC